MTLKKVISLPERCLNEVFEDVVEPEFGSVGKKKKKKEPKEIETNTFKQRF